MTRIFLNGAPIDVPHRKFLGCALVDRFAPPKGAALASEATPPYLFCGNGSCRDCNALVEGLPGIPTCRIPLAPGLSIRVDPETALERQLPRAEPGEPLAADVVIIGGGKAGRTVASFHLGAEVLEARAPTRRPAGVAGGRLVVLDEGRERPIEAQRVVLATGARDAVPSRADVLPMDLVERYVDIGALPVPEPSAKIVLVGELSRVSLLREKLSSLGATSVAVATEIRGEDGVTYVVGTRREPSLALARALGCRTRYDRARGVDVLVLSEEGETSVSGVFATGAIGEGGEADK